MKKIIFFFVLFQNVYTYAWYNDFEEAKKMAIATNKLIVIDFWAKWCRPCLMMESETWSNQTVKNELSDFVTLKLDFDYEKELVTKYGVKLIPSVIITDANGNILEFVLGYKSPKDMIEILKKYKFDKSILENFLLSNFKSDNFKTNIELADAYFQMSLSVEKELKDKIIALGELYTNQAFKKLDKSQKKDPVFVQKKELYNLYSDIFKLKIEKVNTQLQKNFSNFTPLNENSDLYHFIVYTVQKSLQTNKFSNEEINFNSTHPQIDWSNSSSEISNQFQNKKP